MLTHLLPFPSSRSRSRSLEGSSSSSQKPGSESVCSSIPARVTLFSALGRPNCSSATLDGILTHVLYSHPDLSLQLVMIPRRIFCIQLAQPSLYGLFYPLLDVTFDPVPVLFPLHDDTGGFGDIGHGVIAGERCDMGKNVSA